MPTGMVFRIVASKFDLQISFGSLQAPYSYGCLPMFWSGFPTLYKTEC